MLAARDPQALEGDCADLALRHGVTATAHRFDVLELDHHGVFFDALPAIPRIVISVVGLLGDPATDAADPAAARRVMATNYLGPALALEAATARLVELDEDSAIIGFGSVAGDRGRAVNYIYGSAKAGLAAYLSGLRQKLNGSRVLVMTVKPGFVATAMTEGMDLPPWLTASPEAVARRVQRGLEARRTVVYTPRWRLIMALIKLLPEPIFARLRF